MHQLLTVDSTIVLPLLMIINMYGLVEKKGLNISLDNIFSDHYIYLN